MKGLLSYFVICSVIPIVTVTVVALGVGFIGFGGGPALSQNTSDLILIFVWICSIIVSIFVGKRLSDIDLNIIILILLALLPSIGYYLLLSYIP